MLNPKLFSAFVAILIIIAFSSSQSMANSNSITADTGIIFVTDKDPGSKLFRLYQNERTEYSDVTKIKFELKNEAHVILKIIDVSGNTVDELVQGDMHSGVYNVYFKTADNISLDQLSYEIDVNNISQKIKMVSNK